MFYIADAARDGTIGGSLPFWAEGEEEAKAKAFEIFQEMWRDVFEVGAYDDWEDFTADCDGSSILMVPAIEALARHRFLPDIPAELARALIETGETVELMSEEAHNTISGLCGAVDRLAEQIEQMRGMFDDEDGAIEGALDEATEEVDLARKFRKRCTVTIGQATAELVDKAGAALADKEPLPTALYAIDMMIDMGGDVAPYARLARRSLAYIVSAATECHAALAEAMETHIYDLDNGDEIGPDCQYQKALDGLNHAFAGVPLSFSQPASPLPWSMVVAPTVAQFMAADGTLTKMPKISNPTPEDVQEMVALLDGINGRACLNICPEVAVIVEGGCVQNVVARNDQPVIVHIVDYDVEGADACDAVPQKDKDDAGAHLQKFGPRNYDRRGSVEFWNALNDPKPFKID